MKTSLVKSTLHELIDKIEDEKLLEIYMRLLQKEISYPSESNDFFRNSEQEMIDRAKASIKSIDEGRTKNILDFKAEVENWKKKRNIQ